MKNRLLFKGSICLLSSFCLFVSCAKPRENKPILPQTEKIIFHVESVELEPFWDVSDVDISSVDKTRKLIAFTFDDAPVHSFENLVTTFAEYNLLNPDCPASATVFFNGTYLRQNGAAALSAIAVGFELANHTDNHLNLSKTDVETAKREITLVDDYLFALDGKQKHLFRPPYGNLSEEVKSAIETPIINWSIDTLDWKKKTETEIYETVFSQKENGSIVLMHDGYENTIRAVERLLPDLKAAGYQVVSVSQMAKAHGVLLKNGGVYTRARAEKTTK